MCIRAVRFTLSLDVSHNQEAACLNLSVQLSVTQRNQGRAGRLLKTKHATQICFKGLRESQRGRSKHFIATFEAIFSMRAQPDDIPEEQAVK